MRAPERRFEAEITIMDMNRQRAKPIFKAARAFDYLSADADDALFLRMTLINELAKLYADAVVSISVDEQIG